MDDGTLAVVERQINAAKAALEAAPTLVDAAVAAPMAAPSKHSSRRRSPSLALKLAGVVAAMIVIAVVAFNASSPNRAVDREPAAVTSFQSTTPACAPTECGGANGAPRDVTPAPAFAPESKRTMPTAALATLIVMGALVVILAGTLVVVKRRPARGRLGQDDARPSAGPVTASSDPQPRQVLDELLNQVIHFRTDLAQS
ncbi:MAG TPA: hypothetical protein VFB78_00075 [Acidimicrobiales bacterium]|nr:hypothetical protein [Acidimicrobiales bacterium]